jgi:hypothetical protein
MFGPTSRYSTIETTTYAQADGRVLAYKRRRFLPRGQSLPLLAELSVGQGERLDVLATRALGDPEQFWRICDANDAMYPPDLVAESGQRVRVPVPQGPGF